MSEDDEKLVWTGKRPSKTGVYVWQRFGSDHPAGLQYISQEPESGRFYYDNYCGSAGIVKCFYNEWPVDVLWLGPLPKPKRSRRPITDVTLHWVLG